MVNTDRVLVVGATNRPADLDEAARRRLVKRLYIPLPDPEARADLVARLMANNAGATSPAFAPRLAHVSVSCPPSRTSFSRLLMSPLSLAP